MRDLSRLLHPRSLAVVGGDWAEAVVEQCDKAGFQGDIWPVHPTRDAVGGRRCFQAVGDLPGAPDAAFVGVNRHATLDVIADLRAAGCGGAVSFATGFAEVGEADLQRGFVERAGEMPVLGPNCYGLINYLDGAVIWPDQHGGRRVESGVAILSQSSNVAINLTMQRRGLPIAYVACPGNAALVGIAELADAMLADPRVTALGVLMEGVGDAVAFADVVFRARAAGKGVVVLKAGQTDAGQAAVMSHTASLAGGAVASSAYLARIGAGEVQSVTALIEVLKVLHVHGPLTSRSCVSVSCSGGEAGLVADAAEGGALAFPPVPEQQAARLAELLGPIVTVSNPLDYNTFIWGDEARTTEVFTAALEGFGNGLFVIDLPRQDRCETAPYEIPYRAMRAASAATGKLAFAVSLMPEAMTEEWAEGLMAEGIVPLCGVPDALAVVEAASVPEQEVWRPWAAVDDGGEALDEAAGKALLEAAGVAVPPSVTALDIRALDATGLTPPFALKGLGFAHKSEAGAVRLGVVDLGAEPEMPGAAGYLLEEMVVGAVAEVLIGARRDPVYGATLTVGMGGIEAELLADTMTLVLPVEREEVADAFRRLRLWPLLDGYRGRPTADVSAAVNVAMRLQAMLASDETLTEVEINPLMVRETGAVAVDALVRRRDDD